MPMPKLVTGALWFAVMGLAALWSYLHALSKGEPPPAHRAFGMVFVAIGALMCLSGGGFLFGWLLSPANANIYMGCACSGGGLLLLLAGWFLLTGHSLALLATTISPVVGLMFLTVLLAMIWLGIPTPPPSEFEGIVLVSTVAEVGWWLVYAGVGLGALLAFLWYENPSRRLRQGMHVGLGVLTLVLLAETILATLVHLQQLR